MNNTLDLKFIVHTYYPMSTDATSVCFDVPAYLQPKLKPIAKCSDVITAYITGEHSPQMAARLKFDRIRLVEEIAQKLASAIVKQLESHDTMNGYPVKPKH